MDKIHSNCLVVLTNNYHDYLLHIYQKHHKMGCQTFYVAKLVLPYSNKIIICLNISLLCFTIATERSLHLLLSKYFTIHSISFKIKPILALILMFNQTCPMLLSPSILLHDQYHPDYVILNFP